MVHNKSEQLVGAVAIVVVFFVVLGFGLECPADGDCKSSLISASTAFVIEKVITTT